MSWHEWEGAGEEGLGLGRGLRLTCAPRRGVRATSRGAQVPSKRSCTKHRPQGQKRTHTLYVLSLLKPAPPFSQIKAVCLNISFLQSEFTFKVQSANTMCFCFCFFNCFLVREPPTRLGTALDVSATYPRFLGWKRKDEKRDIITKFVSLIGEAKACLSGMR